MKRKIFSLMATVALVLALGVSARADSASFIIDVPNSGLSGTPGPYATVDLLLIGSTVKITVTMESSFTAFGQNGVFGFNVKDGDTTGLAVGSFTTNAGYTGTALSLGSLNAQMDGFGNFDVTINDGNPPNNLTSFSFIVSRTNGFASVQDLVDTSCGGEFCGAHFVVHIAPTNGNPTGFAGDAGTPVPEPGSLMLFGTGLLSMAGFLRRKLFA